MGKKSVSIKSAEDAPETFKDFSRAFKYGGDEVVIHAETERALRKILAVLGQPYDEPVADE